MQGFVLHRSAIIQPRLFTLFQVFLFLVSFTATLGHCLPQKLPPCTGASQYRQGSNCQPREELGQYKYILKKRNDDGDEDVEVEGDNELPNDSDRLSPPREAWFLAASDSDPLFASFKRGEKLAAGENKPRPDGAAVKKDDRDPTKILAGDPKLGYIMDKNSQEQIALPEAVGLFLEQLPEWKKTSDKKSYYDYELVSRKQPKSRMAFQVSVLNKQIIVNWKGPEKGWDTAGKGYAEIEVDYAGLLFIGWRNAAGLQENNGENLRLMEAMKLFPLESIVVTKLQNPNTIKVLERVKQEEDLEGDDIFVLKPEHALSEEPGELFIALLGVPEIGAVQELLSRWPNIFESKVISMIAFYLQESESGVMEATIYIGIQKERYEAEVDVATLEEPINTSFIVPETEVVVEAELRSRTNDLVFFPGIQYFGMMVPLGGRSYVDSFSGESITRAVFRQSTARLTVAGESRAMHLDISSSLTLKAIVIESMAPEDLHLRPGVFSRCIYEAWRRQAGFGLVRILAFLELSPAAILILRELYQDNPTTRPSDRILATNEETWRRMGRPGGDDWETVSKINSAIIIRLRETVEYGSVLHLLLSADFMAEQGWAIDLDAIEIGVKPRPKGTSADDYAILFRFFNPHEGLDAEKGEKRVREIVKLWRSATGQPDDESNEDQPSDKGNEDQPSDKSNEDQHPKKKTKLSPSKDQSMRAMTNLDLKLLDDYADYLKVDTSEDIEFMDAQVQILLEETFWGNKPAKPAPLFDAEYILQDKIGDDSIGLGNVYPSEIDFVWGDEPEEGEIIEENAKHPPKDDGTGRGDT
ncbi:hypothetical protein TWF730_011201 [Orbilia blumenaviensis]|uniref:Uncharacterized protein n=1 Tax=Orbilia blumenaviensis TaxID=1796055 RepID=A0AAV9UKL2_9PEZI